MQAHDTSAPKGADRRPVLLALTGLLAALSLSACAPATSTGTTGAAAMGTGATGTSGGTISSAGASTTGTATGTPAGGTAAATSDAPGTGPDSNTATSARDNTNLATLITSDDRFTTLARLVQTAGLTDTLASGQYTIFAPTNDAFLRLSPSDLSALSADPVRLRQVLLYHVVPTRVTGSVLASVSRLATAQSGLLTISRPSGTNEAGTRTLVNGANIEPSSIDTSNGVLYAIDAVLMPPAR